MKTKVDLTNNFFDISKLPADWGLLILPISMARLANAQAPETCIEYLRWISKTKIQAPTVGVHIIYGDSLYLNNDIAENGIADLNKKRLMYMQEAETHKFRMLKLIKKLRTSEFQIPQAFEFTAWNQALLNTKNFASHLSKLKKIYNSDILFQKYLKEDSDYIGRKCTEAQINFFLEEHLFAHLMGHGNTVFHNIHVQDRQKWILWCYPGRPPKALIYLNQLNPFKLVSTNKYEKTQYNLTEKKLFNAKNINLESYSLI